uniref:YitT family protein n=1 Tax=Thaumasiovibrio occultus TaxID=1891184 RepID=UPI000B35602D|nr:YitT family protein [Thaumasiovibrio occultus]
MNTRKHSIIEDAIAILSATFIVAQGVFFLQQGGLLTGGTTGLALLASQFVGLSFGTLYFLFNCPFYLMAWFRMGKSFAITSLISGGLVSIMADHIPLFFSIESLQPLYCAIIGGLLMGVGMLMLFRHQTSLGGFNVLCLFCQEKFGISAGKMQMGIDCTILIASFFMLTPVMLMYSVIGAVMLNMVLTMNHKPGRYSSEKAAVQPS